LHDNPDQLWHELRTMGVRRASDLFSVDGLTLCPQIEKLAKNLGTDATVVDRLKSMVGQLKTDESFSHIWSWRANNKQPKQTWTIKSNGTVALENEEAKSS
jgi:hypothetical protein